MTRPQLDVNFFEKSAIDDPFPLYEQVRAVGPVVWNELMQGWLATGFDDCWTVLTDNGERFAVMNDDPDVTPWFEAPNIISSEGERHARLRTALAPLFTRRAVAHWENRIREVVDGLLAPLAAGAQTLDLIADFTMIPTIIVAEMLGVPEERHEDFRRWSNTIVTNLSYGQEDEAARTALRTAGAELNAYLGDEIERHRRERPDDLFTTMIDAVEQGTMDEGEVRSTAVLLLVAGYDTTAKTLSNALVAFELHPGQRAQLVDNPGLVPAAIEEVLRWRGTVQAIPRRVARDTVLAGTPVAAGEVVYAMVAAANRDPDRWADPGRFDIHRPRQPHFGFGYGRHLCLGAPLARLETKAALERLLRLAPDYRLSRIDFGPSWFVRGPERGFLDLKTAAVR